MSRKASIRILTGIFADVEAPRDATPVEVVGALCAVLHLGDGPYHLELRGQSQPPLEPLNGSGPFDLEPRALATSFASQMACVGDWVQVGELRIRTVDSGGKPIHDRLSNPGLKETPQAAEEKERPVPSGGNGPFCTNCGLPLGTADACDGCGAAAAGNVQVEKVEHTEGRPFALPPMCCCCLRPKELTHQHKVFYKQEGNTRVYLFMEMPWCRACKSRNSTYRFVGGVIAATSIAGGIGGGYVASEHGAGGWVTFFAGAAAFLAAFTILRVFEHLPMFKERGHVRGCDAFPGATPGSGSSKVQILFRNRKFAKVWRSVNSEAGS